MTYKAEGFLEKNRDTLAMDVVSAFRLSENTLVRTLFGADEEDMKAAKKAAKTKAKAGAADVKKKLRQSMKKVRRRTEPEFDNLPGRQGAGQDQEDHRRRRV